MGEATAPLVRARHMKQLAAAVARLPAAEAGRVREALAPATLRAIEDATGVEWLPAALNLELTLAVHAALGEEGFGRFFRDAQREAFSGPLLRIVVEAAARVFRVDAASFAAWVGRGWGLVFRGCGAWVVERAGAREAVLRIEGLPPPFRSEVWLRSVAHSLDAFWEIAGASGAFRLERADDAGNASYRVSWR